MKRELYRLIMGEMGSEVQKIRHTRAKSERGAKIALGKLLAQYGKDNWGYIERGSWDEKIGYGTQWQRI